MGRAGHGSRLSLQSVVPQQFHGVIGAGSMPMPRTGQSPAAAVDDTSSTSSNSPGAAGTFRWQSHDSHEHVWLCKLKPACGRDAPVVLAGRVAPHGCRFGLAGGGGGKVLTTTAFYSYHPPPPPPPAHTAHH
jgi:hypothetical protein